MAGNNHRVLTGQLDVCVGRPNHPIDTPARNVVDEGIQTIPPRVPGKEDVGLFEIYGQITICMRRSVVADPNKLVAPGERLFRLDQDRWARVGNHCVECAAPLGDTYLFIQMFGGVAVRNDRRSGVVSPSVSVRVIPVPVRIDYVAKSSPAVDVTRTPACISFLA